MGPNIKVPWISQLSCYLFRFEEHLVRKEKTEVKDKGDHKMLDLIEIWYVVREKQGEDLILSGIFPRRLDAQKWVCGQEKQDDFQIEEKTWYQVIVIITDIALGRGPE